MVDQFEQVFTQCSDEKQRQAFITALCATAARDGLEQDPAALIVLGVRADFEARCADYPQLADAIQDRYLVTSMTERQLRMAITEPAKRVGSSVDEDLVDVLLEEVSTRQPASSPAVPGRGSVSGAGILPLLSHALDQAWRSRAGDVLTLADYERTGGIEGAVADSAQRAYDHLTPAQQAAARQVFTRLTATTSESVDTADRASPGGTDRRQGRSTRRGMWRRSWRPSPPNGCSPWPPGPWRSATKCCSPPGPCCATPGSPRPTPTGSSGPGCITPQPTGHVAPVTLPTCTAVAC